MGHIDLRSPGELAKVSRRELEAIDDAAAIARDAVKNGQSSAESLRKLAEAGILGIRIPPKFGGISETPCGHLVLNDTLCEISSELAFLVQQHTGVTALVQSARRDQGAGDLLQQMSNGTILAAPAASHLRNRDAAGGILATEGAASWDLNGMAPYVSGYKIMSHILLAAEVHNEPSLFFLVPFQEQAGLRFTATLSLWALQDTNTVSIQCDRLTLGYAEQLGRDLTNYFNATHPGMLAYNAAFSLGLARRAVIMFREITLTTSMAALELATFCQRLSDCSVDFYRLASVPAEARSDRHFDDLLETRIAATRLALDAALALIAVTGGRSQLASSSANRLLREITFFMVTTINNDTKRSFARSFLGGNECEAGESGGNSSEELSACRH